MAIRNRELRLLIPVVFLVTAGFTAVYVAQRSRLDLATVIYGAIFLGLCGAGHIVIRRRVPFADPHLYPIVALLAAIGMVMLYRIDGSVARDQAVWFAVALVFFALALAFLRDLSVLERYRYVIAAGGIVLLILPRLPVIGSQVNGAYLAINFGAFSFQPAEISKLAIVVFLASYLAEKRDIMVVTARRVAGISLPPIRQFGPLLVVWGAAILLLVVIRDLGTAIMFFGAFLAMVYVATTRISFVAIGIVLFLLGAWAAYALVPHVTVRFDIWINPWADASGSGYQIAQSLFAQADGGLSGRGLGESLLFLQSGAPIIPAPDTDMIYAVLADDLGLLGAAGVLAGYLLFVERGFRIATQAADPFQKLLATGLTAVFALQVFVIVGGVTRTIPLTGVTLPFISAGGSSLVFNFVLLGILLTISDSTRRDELRVRRHPILAGGR